VGGRDPRVGNFGNFKAQAGKKEGGTNNKTIEDHRGQGQTKSNVEKLQPKKLQVSDGSALFMGGKHDRNFQQKCRFSGLSSPSVSKSGQSLGQEGHDNVYATSAAL